MGSEVKPNRKVYSIEEISRIVTPIADEMGIERIYLFGSYARGEATPESDVDVVVESESDVLVHGSGFDPEFGSGHFRTITLPQMEVLEEAYDKLERFISRHVA